ncbi:hypothetical protein SARC_07695 [Sphaeroforma arctica JP610]|uniref:Amidohydrolase-related domain-containing protein n=1 Tax=Sphaeroforma arctica JP610 TaxID=667725 RepID=A0A0L0FTB9_9EUKA|nr:hypothetical protein SARC_07695 [Sphaeroforma arctica JP610]KNC79924.1 hypothetical protein SARC_07695 [Sphaeroforma arctica JP610]|eukprot:XP_014153826.1 hypothetical protein SARC_07695 [Sphaeroforma arctica JP610]
MTVASSDITQPNQRICAEWTWTGTSFERGIFVGIGADGVISSVELSESSDHNVNHVDGILLPGFVNAHSHAFQRLLRGKGEVYSSASKHNSFWGWRDEMYNLVNTLGAKEFKAACVLCFTEMLDAGITCVGEFHYFHHGDMPYQYDSIVLEAAKEVGIRIVLLNAYYEFAGCGKKELSEAQKRFETHDLDAYWKQLDSLSDYKRGVVAHSIRAVDPVELGLLVRGARDRNLPFHMHLEEQVAEIEQCKASFDNKTPLRVLLDLDISLDHVTLVHCTHSEDAEMQAFVARGGMVCVCPLTEGALADGLPNLQPMSGQICLGTDCNARIDFLEEMRWLEYGQRVKTNRRGAVCHVGTTWVPDLSAELLRYATEMGAKALGVDAGCIEVGKLADFVVLKVDCENVMEMLPTAIFGDAAVGGVCVGGKWVREYTSSSATVSADSRVRKGVTVDVGTGFVKNGNSGTPQKRARVEPCEEGSLDQSEAACVRRVMDAGDDVVALARSLVDINSTSGSEQHMAAAVTSWLVARGWNVAQQAVGSRYNLHCVRNHANGEVNSAPPKVYMNTHLDVVPPWFPSTVDDTNLYGRGACDTKSLIAAMLIAAQTLTETNRSAVGLLFVVSEETTHEGMIKANELGINPQYLIVGEPTDAKVVLLQKGILKCTLTAKGVAAHSGYPHLGRSAIDDMLGVLGEIRAYAFPQSESLGVTNVNVGKISGGQAVNALAEECSAELLFRLISAPETVLEVVEGVCSKYADVSAKVITKNDPVDMTYVNDLITGFDFGTACFNTDIPYFNFDGKAVLYGHGSITDAHCPREYIALKDLKSLVPAYVDLVKQLSDKC